MDEISIHALLTESDNQARLPCIPAELFQSTLSSRRATGIVYPDSAGPSLFQSTLSSRRATGLLTDAHPDENLFQSTLSSRRATDAPLWPGRWHPISIHALLTESDLGVRQRPEAVPQFQSTLSSRRATEKTSPLSLTVIFQSTLSSRRATGGSSLVPTAKTFQSTLSSRRATCPTVWKPAISAAFQSTLSSRRATGRFRSAPLAGRYFNPRSPHGERHASILRPA